MHCVKKDTASCYRGSVVCLCVCLLVTTVIPTKMAEPTEMPFGAWTRMGIRNRVLGAGPDPPKSKRQFFLGGRFHAMRPFVKILLPLVIFQYYRRNSPRD